MLKKVSNRIMVLLIMLIMTFSMSGCGEQLKEFAGTTFTQALGKRIEANTNIAANLYNSGYIKEATYKNIVNTLNAQQVFYFGEGERLKFEEKKTEDGNEVPTGTMFKNAISNYQLLSVTKTFDVGTVVWEEDNKSATISINAEYYIDDEGNKVRDDEAGGSWYSSTDLTNFIISNYLHTEFDCSRDTDLPSAWRDRRSRDIVPLDIIGVKPGTGDGASSDDIEAFINSGFNLDCKIYVLKPNIDPQYLGANYSIDMLCQTIQSKLINGTPEEKKGVLSTYFYNPNELTLQSLGFDMKSLVCISEANFDSNVNTPGYDLVIQQSEQDVLTIRFLEFNQEAVDQFEKIIGAKSNRFYYIDTLNGASEPSLILMEYPVYRLNHIEVNDANLDKASISFNTNAELGINLFNGNIIKYKNGTFDGTEYSSNVDSYLTVTNNSSFSIIGGMTIELTAIKAFNKAEIDEFCAFNSWPTVKVDTAHIVLTDYLETTYAPGLVDGENLVNFGRKIRFIIEPSYLADTAKSLNSGKKVQRLLVPKTANLAYYIDKDGIRYNGTQDYYMTALDFCDYNELLKETPVVKSLTDRDRAYNLDAKKEGTPENIDDLRHEYKRVDSIITVVKFPGDKVGNIDYTTDNDDKQLLWGITTNKGIFGQHSLFNTWITSTSKTASLDWWNSYLETNGFLYRVGYAEVESYLMGNFTYELQREGIVILDLDTIAFIQEEMDEEAETERTELIRTIFIVLGWGLICYSLFLILAWVFDTNSDMGLDILTKLTFGNWVAVKHPEDIPSKDLSDTRFIDAKGICISCVILIAVAILIINVDIIKLVILLIDTFGSIASRIEQMLKGSH